MGNRWAWHEIWNETDMIPEMLHVIKGNFIWHYIKAVHGIGMQSIVLVLTGENKMVDEHAIRHLQTFVARRSADKVYVWTEREELINKAEQSCELPVRRLNASAKKMQLLFDYYCYDKFFPNLIFTYTNRPRDNQIGRLLSISDVNEEEIVCLGLYNLRMVPQEVK